MARLSTAQVLAAAAVLQARTGADGPAWNARVAEACLRHGGGTGARLLQALGTRTGRGLLRLLEDAMLPGITAHYAWRKRRIRAWVEQACADGTGQVVILGAGFDGLGAELAGGAAQPRVYEVDLAPTIALKRRALASLRFDQPRLHFVACDLAQAALPAALVGAPQFDPDAATLVIAEGVVMYLPIPAALRLLHGLAGLLRQARCIATAMQTRADGRADFVLARPWLRHWLRWNGEPFRWGCSRAALPGALRRAGLAMDALADPDDQADPDPCPGEWLFAGTLLPGPPPALGR
ncbi:class I SAM-dependent methyltransferase [Xanthomonas bundabergensis]|uniref:class I SAM-dependent methyltransferase n=1 Tax=Xanthomonas bundabergensis TaxID=3160842 RepID=UPI0035177E3D